MTKKHKMHIILPDPQVRPGTPTHHLKAVGNMVVELQPDVFVCMGDFWDMHSLSQYDMGRIAGEKARYLDDIKAGNAAMDILLAPIKKFQGTKPGKNYKPRMIFIMGNHENRIMKHMEAHPYLEGVFHYEEFNLRSWAVYKFLTLAEADGVYYSHYFYNPMSGKAYGGSIQNMLNKIGVSFTMGHQQRIAYDRKDLPNGKTINGLVAGACYIHDEAYKGPQGNHHWRGVIVKHNVRLGNYDLETCELPRLLEIYG